MSLDADFSPKGKTQKKNTKKEKMLKYLQSPGVGIWGEMVVNTKS